VRRGRVFKDAPSVDAPRAQIDMRRAAPIDDLRGHTRSTSHRGAPRASRRSRADSRPRPRPSTRSLTSNQH
jgi:hypothetical protein